MHVTMQYSVCQVNMAGKLTDAFVVTQGFKKEDSLTFVLFNVVLEYIIRWTQIETNSTIPSRLQQICGCADNLDVMERSTSTIKEYFIKLKESAKEMRLCVNRGKSKMMHQSRRQGRRLRQNTAFENYNFGFEEVQSFTCLSSVITSDGMKLRRG